MTETKYLDAEFCGHDYPEEGNEIHVAGDLVDMICLASPIEIREQGRAVAEPTCPRCVTTGLVWTDWGYRCPACALFVSIPKQEIERQDHA